jgi:hypothetical protein
VRCQVSWTRFVTQSCSTNLTHERWVFSTPLDILLCASVNAIILLAYRASSKVEAIAKVWIGICQSLPDHWCRVVWTSNRQGQVFATQRRSPQHRQAGNAVPKQIVVHCSTQLQGDPKRIQNRAPNIKGEQNKGTIIII